MSKLLILYDNHPQTILHDFLESCADTTKQMCFENGIDYSSLCPPSLNEQNVRDHMQAHSMCVVAAHGDSNGVYNEKDMPLVSLDTANYNFQGKGFYGISCLCAQKLRTHLLDNIGALLFVGYKETFNVRGEYEPFITCALSGLKCLLEGKNVADAYQEMLLEYEKQIDILDIVDPMAAKELLHNMESLVFCGNKSLVLNDLN